MRGLERLAIIGVLLLAWLTRLHNVFRLATQADEGVHITVARLVAKDGLRIYADLFENRTPGVEWLLAGLFRLVGPDLFAARVLTLGVALITVALVYVIGRQLARGLGGPAYTPIVTGLTAATLFTFSPLHLHWSRFVMLEHYSAAAVAASIMLAIHAHRKMVSTHAWFFAGLLAGVAVVFKQTELVLVGAMLAYLVLLALTSARAANYAASRWILGLALALALLLITLAAQDAIQPFFRFTSSAGQIAPLQNLEPKGIELLNWAARRPIPWLVLFSFTYLTGSIRSFRRRGSLTLLFLWFAAEVAFLLLPPVLDLSKGGFSHYLVPVLVPASILAGTGVAAAWDMLRRWPTRRRYASMAAALLLMIFVTPAWMEDLWTVITDRTYPQATLEQEKHIARAAELLSAPQEPIQVFANATFYHRAQRLPSGPFFHWPNYLAQSPLAAEAIAGVARALEQVRPPAVLVSRLHLQERLPQQILDVLWQNYTPAALFPYAYQRDVLIFVPRTPVANNEPPLARIGQIAELAAVDVRWLDPQNLLVSLSWRALSAPEQDFTVFAHILDRNGALLAQDDAQPVVGFRPTSTWRDGEAVLDYHWISIPEGTTMQDSSLSIGLYDPATGERLPTNTNGVQGDAYTQPLPAAP
ncbi:MAG: ArnT family glycosyltransferase [Chloroflexota bacterium]